MSAIKKCRTCLKFNKKMQSLNAKPKMLKSNKTYMDLLKELTKIMIDSEDECKFPQKICVICSKKIRDSYIFIAQVYKCHRFLMHKEIPSGMLAENCVSERFALEEEESCIKLELTTAQEEPINIPIKEGQEVIHSDSCSSVSDKQSLPNDIDKTDALKLPKDISTTEDNVKTEPGSKNVRQELYPECVINETEFNEDNANSDDESSLDQDSHSDPLDNEANDDNTPAVEDEMLPVRCDECERVFANSLLLTRHKKDTHLPDELKIQCPSCPVKFSRRYNMYAHMRTFHKTETVREHQIQPRKLTKTDICDQCHRSYSDKYKLMAHIKNKHGPGSVPKKPKQPPKQYLCTLCGLTCTNKSNLEIHYRRRHTGEKPFKCDFCDRGFTRSYEVKVHRRTHTGESPYKCTVCEKAFKRSNKLKIHMRIHTNERPYKCTECEKAFRESKDLNIHRRTHTGERPYKCSICQSTFTQSNSLKLHQKKKKHFPESVSSVQQSTEFTHAINTFL